MLSPDATYVLAMVAAWPVLIALYIWVERQRNATRERIKVWENLLRQLEESSPK